MLTRRRFLAAGAAFSLVSTAGLSSQTAATPELQFNGTGYFFRWTNDRLFEFTPRGQEDLDKWTEMVSVVADREANSPDKLAGWANGLLGGYKAKHGLLRTNSIPATPQDPAQYFIAGILMATGVVECVFNRFLLMHDVGYDFIYSHRYYGADMKQNTAQAVDWIKANGPAIESAVMKFAPVPDINALEHWKQSNPLASR
jgi:hypothetical protein